MLAVMAIDVSTILNSYDVTYYLYRLSGDIDLVTGLYIKTGESITKFSCHDQPAKGDEIMMLPEMLRGDEIRKIYTAQHLDLLNTPADVTVQAQLVSDSSDRTNSSASWWRIYNVKRYGYNRHYKALMVPIGWADATKTLDGVGV